MRSQPLLIVLFTCCSALSAQYEGRIFNTDYTFEEGVFLTHESWLANAPDYRWEDIDGEMVQLPEDYRVQIAGMRLKNGQELSSIYAISLDGFPYLYVREDEARDFHEFAGLRFRGQYGFIRYHVKVRTSRMMYAYNPVNGRPFRQAEVERERTVEKAELIDVLTGERLPLNKSNVLDILEDYPDLSRAVTFLNETDPAYHSKLTQAIKLFNERNPLLLPQLP